MLYVSSNSIPGRIYAYWERLTGGNPYNYQENLCHFVRVVLFWTWWYAFWEQKILRTFVRAWMIFSVGIYIALVIKFPIILVYSIAIPVAVGLLMLIFWAIGKSCAWLSEMPVWTWFWNERLFPLGYPWTITLVAIQTAALLLNRDVFWAISGVEALVLAIVIVVAAAVLIVDGISMIKDAFSNRKASILTRRSAVKTMPSWKIAIEYVKSKKRGICPYIKIV